MKNPIRSLAGMALLVLTAACVAAPEGQDVFDPYEDFNRDVHAFNTALDQAVLRDAGQVAEALPEELTRPVMNFSNNVSLPGMVVNGLLQGDVPGAATNIMRFLINSTVGVLGLADPAGVIGLEEQDTDFGETLAVWGVPEGAYLELPLFGPSTQRDAVGRIVDIALDPLDRLGVPAFDDYGTATRIAEQVIERGQLGSTLDDILYGSADGYAQARLIFLQNRRFELGQTGAETADTDFVDPFEDF